MCDLEVVLAQMCKRETDVAILLVFGKNANI